MFTGSKSSAAHFPPFATFVATFALTFETFTVYCILLFLLQVYLLRTKTYASVWKKKISESEFQTNWS